MPDAFQAEFTGERVIPGRVEDNLFNEHVARYRFTARLFEQTGGGGKLLDAGCGAGYGTAELARAGAQVLGIDVSEEAIAHARANYSTGPNVQFEQASCMAIPAEDGAFRMVAAFEVIEHLADWRGFLREAGRVLDDSGLFVVSTPNRLYYAESREKAGPNPFHVHEFTESEFRAELESVFPQVKILLQNHVEGIAFSSESADGAALEISDRKADPESAHFFLAVCGKQPLPALASFVFIPQSGNVLQTRERHIALLDGEIRKKNQWIEREQAERKKMLDKVRDMETELEEHNRWAQKANSEAERRAQLVAALQTELQKSNEWAQQRDREAVERGQVIDQLQQELRKSNEWAQQRDAEAVDRGLRVEQLQTEVAQAVAWAKEREAAAEERGKRVADLQAEVAQATEWATSQDAEAQRRGQRIVELQEEIAATITGYEAAIAQWRRDKAAADQWALDTGTELDAAREALAAKEIEWLAAQAEAEHLRAQLALANSQLDMIAQSRWVRLGRTVRIGPEIHRD